MEVAPAQVFVYMGVARHSRTNAVSVGIAVKSTPRAKVLLFGRNRTKQSSTFLMKTLKMTFAVPLEMPNSVLAGFRQSFIKLKTFQVSNITYQVSCQGGASVSIFFPLQSGFGSIVHKFGLYCV